MKGLLARLLDRRAKQAEAPCTAMAIYRPLANDVFVITRWGAMFVPADEVPGVIAAMQGALATRDIAGQLTASGLQ